LDLIEHVPDVTGVLAEINRVTCPGGILHLHVPCEGNRLSLYRPLLKKGIDLTRDAVGHLHHFRTREVIKHLCHAGFAITKKRYSMYPIGQLHDMIGWKSRIQNRPLNEPENPATAKEQTPQHALIPRSRKKRLRLGDRGWKIAQALMTRGQYLEVHLAGWQPIGAIGLCVTAMKQGSTSPQLDLGPDTCVQRDFGAAQVDPNRQEL
jgi:hypothetical protein